MMIKSCAPAVFILSLLMSHGPGMAFMAPERIEMSVGIAVQSAGGSLLDFCRDSAAVEGRLDREMWVLAEPPPVPAGSEVSCGPGALAETTAGPGEQAEAPAWGASVTTTARLVRRMEDEQNLHVEVSASLRWREGPGPHTEADFRHSEIKRRFVFTEGGQAIVPLRMNNSADPDTAYDQEIFLRVTVRASDNRDVTTRGSILLRSDLDDTELYIDGGLAGHLPAGQETLLPNVRAGVRLLEVRDGEGRRVRQGVRVLPGRTVLVDFRHPDATGQYAEPWLQPLGANDWGFEEFRRRADGAVVVRIPAGEFLMGNAETEREPLEHTVWVSDVLMDRTGVTWNQFKQFAAATGAPLPPHPPYWGFLDDHPAVYVTWAEAQNYCNWAWGRLPTEAEREKAARGTDGRKFPWGDSEPEPGLAVFRRSWGFESTAPVGVHPAGASPYGLMDMGGNVWEWCADWYADDYYENSPYRDPQGPESGMAHVVRGGSWDSRPSVLSASCRSWGHPGYRDGDFGFRCAMNAPGPSGAGSGISPPGEP